VYARNEDLPEQVRTKLSDHCQTIFREVWNRAYSDHGDEQRAFATAWTAGNECAASEKRESPMTDIPAVRFVDGSDDTIEGLAVPFGVADLYATRFTPETDLALDWLPERPVLYAHGLDPAVRHDPVGVAREAKVTDKGVWVKAQLDKRHAWYNEIRQLVEQGALGWSHGTLEYLIEASPPGPDGIREIKRWPIVEFTLTPAPANPAARAYAARDAEPILRIVAEALRGWLPEGTTEGDLEDGDFAWLSDAYKRGDEPPSAGRKLPYKAHGKVDPNGWRAAWTRAHQMADSDFAGGPSRDEVIRRLLRDKPEEITVSEEQREAPPLREGRRNSAADLALIQQIHDLAVQLDAVCGGADENQPDEPETEPVDEQARPAEAGREAPMTIQIVGGDLAPVRTLLAELVRLELQRRLGIR
jgi:cation transport regulator ChaB